MRRLSLTLLLLACDDGGSADHHSADVGDPSPEDRGLADVAEAPDAGPDALLDVPDLGPLMQCAADADCGAGAYCEAAACVPVPPPFFAPVMDGVTRAAATPFEIAPDYLERWHDRAGEDCPTNRPGRFEGTVVGPPRECEDAYDDTDEDGVFDAVWMGGGERATPANGLDNDNPPAGRVLVLARDEVLRVIVVLDVFAVDIARATRFRRRVATRVGVDPKQVMLHATGVWHGPDAVGLWGPRPAIRGGPDAFFARVEGGLGLLADLPWRSGVDPAWWDQVTERAVAAIRGASLSPVTARSGAFRVPVGQDMAQGRYVVPDQLEDGLANDASDLAAYRAHGGPFARDDGLPPRRDARGYVITLESRASGATVAALVGWSAIDAHRAATGGRLSAGFPGLTRAALELALPGSTAVYLTSAGSTSVRVDERTFVPHVSEAGQLLGPDERVVQDPWDAADAPDPQQALGRYISRAALRALEDVDPVDPALSVRSRWVWLPMTNPNFGLAARLGVMKPLSAWITGREVTPAWTSGDMTPACGELGCARTQMDRVTLGGAVLVTTPGALHGRFVRGAEQAEVPFDDRRALTDLDGDGTPDGRDDEIVVMARAGEREVTVRLAGPANPQRSPAAERLGSETVWIVGHTNGGVGTLEAAEAVPPVFEGELAPLVRFGAAPENAAIDVCAAGYPCSGVLSVGELTERALTAHPEALADIVGVHELVLEARWEGVVRLEAGWQIETAEGEVRAAGGPLLLGPGDRAFAETADLRAAGVAADDWLVVSGEEADQRWRIVGFSPLRVAQHPNAGDARLATSPAAGDLVYNVACELIFDGVCPHRRAIFGPDPNATLPREP